MFLMGLIVGLGVMYLTMCALESEYRRHGIGRILSAIQRAQSISKIIS